MEWLLLFLLSVFTYFIIKRSVANITRTPIWILWLVIMIPPLIWSAWTLIHGEDKPMPIALSIGPFIVCPVLYWILIQLGRKDLNSPPAPPIAGTEKMAGDSSSPDRSTPQIASAADEKSLIRPINKTEEDSLRNCFPWSVYYLENIEYRPQAVICKGKLRSNPEVAYQTIQENIQGLFGDRFFVLFQENINSKPFFALVPNPQSHPDVKQQSTPLTRPFLALGLLVATLYTTTIIGAKLSGIPGSIRQLDSDNLRQGIPYAVAIITILGIHELGHYLCARFYKIRATLPYFIPVPFFPGTFGAFVQKRDPVPNRKALFDIGIVSSLSSFVATIPILFWGLAHSDVVSLSEKSNLFNFNSLDPRFSFLLTLFSKLALGNELTPKMAIHLHPVAVAGYIGLIWAAFNLMPVGQLNGGNIVHAMFGQKTAIIISWIARLLMLLLSLVQPDLLLWAIILLFIPVGDRPCLNDVSELNNWRDFWGLVALAILISIVLPPPGTITQLLHI